MRATEFEFRQRFWIFGALFWGAFLAYAVDHVNAAEGLLRLVAGSTEKDPARWRHEVQALLGCGAALVGLAALVRTWAAAYLDSERVHDMNLRTEGLVAEGPFRHVRNPLYFGNLLLAAGMGLFASRLGLVIILAGNVIFLLRLIGREEEELLATQGEPYARYLAAVPRLLPAWRPRVPSGGARPRWGQAFAGEIFFWTLFLACLDLAVTLQARRFPWIVGAGLVLYVGTIVVLRRRRQGAGAPPPP
jgi:protein-S-isoprenylcysteine O-methyltransferase Ste14